MVSAQAQAELSRMFSNRGSAAATLAESRHNWEAEALKDPLPEGTDVLPVIAGGVPGEWIVPPQSHPARVFLFLHGGGYNSGSPKTHRKLAAHLGQAAGMRVLLPDYRLAPEHPHPAGVKDALLAYGWLLSEGRKAQEIVLGGDSAGGGLALSMLLALREAGATMPRAAVLLSPWTDLTLSGESYQRIRDRDPDITREGLQQSAEWYAGRRDPADPMLSPLFASLNGLPPMLIHAGSEEVMLDDSTRFADRAQAAGVPVTLKVWPGLWHVFHHAAHVPEARQAIEEIGQFIRSQFATIEFPSFLSPR